MQSSAIFPARINIHSELNGALLEAVNRANRMIGKRWGSEILFRANGGFAIPHITMLMGEVGSAEVYNEILFKLAEQASAMPPIRQSVGAPYLVSQRSRFVFADVEPSGDLRDRRMAIAESLNGLIDFDHHGGPRNISHVTLGYAIDHRAEVSVLNDIFLGATSFEQRWMTSLVGSRGTAVRILDAVELTGAKP